MDRKDEFVERVERGISLLNDRCPEWLDHVNLTSLRMTDDYECILGQVFGSYNHGLYQLRLSGKGVESPQTRRTASVNVCIDIFLLDRFECDR